MELHITELDQSSKWLKPLYVHKQALKRQMRRKDLS